MQIIANLYLGILVASMVALMIGIPVPSLPMKRSERLQRRLGWANAAVVFAVALICAVTR